MDPEGGHGVWTLVAIGFPRNTGTDPSQEAIGPLGSICFIREVHTILCEKNNKSIVRLVTPPPTKFSGTTHDMPPTSHIAFDHDQTIHPAVSVNEH